MSQKQSTTSNPKDLILFWLWPKINGIDSARWASREGFGAALLCAVTTGILVVLSEFGINILPAENFDVWALADVVFFGAIAWGIYRFSRVASILGLVAYAVGKFVWLNEGGIDDHKLSFVGPVIMVFLFIAGLRGTFAYHYFRKTESNNAPVVEPQADNTNLS